MTHRLLSANTEEDQTSPSTETPHDKCLSPTQPRMLCMNREKRARAIKTHKKPNLLRFLHQHSRRRSRSEVIIPACSVECSRVLQRGFSLNVYSCWIMRKATVAISQVKPFVTASTSSAVMFLFTAESTKCGKTLHEKLFFWRQNKCTP